MTSTVKHASCKWLAHYEKLVLRGKNRVLEGYSENHHVIPSCMGGSDEPENMVRLTPEEHYVAHQMLMKIYPNHHGVVKAAMNMLVSSPTTPRNNKMYSWIRKRVVETMSSQMTEWHKNNVHPFKGKHHTEEAKQKIGKSIAARPKKKAFCFDPISKQLIKVYESVQSASDALGINGQTIFSCIRIPGKRSAAGFFWSYNDNPELPDNVCVLLLPDGTKSVRLKRGMKYNRKKKE